MALRVKTDIDLGQNNLLNGGFERVIALPLENNVLGRQVLYQGKPYWWNGTEWISWTEIDPNQFWQTDKANAEVSTFVKIERGFDTESCSIWDLVTSAGLNFDVGRNYEIALGIDPPGNVVTLREHLFDGFYNFRKNNLTNIRYQFLLKQTLKLPTVIEVTNTPITVRIPRVFLYDQETTLNPPYVFVNNALLRGDYYEFSFTDSCRIDFICTYHGYYFSVYSDDDIALSTRENNTLVSFLNENNVEKSTLFNKFSLHSLLVAVINKLNQGGGGATGDFWSLTQANAETSACEVTINNSAESIFPQVLAAYGDYIHSRNIFVALVNYSDESSYVFDLFGDISNVPIGVRYSIFIAGYNGSLKLDFPKQYLTNISALHTPDGMSEERYTIAYSGATKIDFIKLGDSVVWVDVAT